MPFVSVTRLRVRSLLYLPQFLWRTFHSVHQTERAPGFLGGRLLREVRNTYWTVTLWQDDGAMKTFRVSGAHRAAMPKLLEWCDEASVVNRHQETDELPSWPEAHRRMVQEGRPSKVNHPSADQLAFQIPTPQPSRVDRDLKPRTNP